MTYKGVTQVIVTIAFLLLTVSGASGQCPVSVLTPNLMAPTKAIISTKGNLLVAEEGNGVNTGRISIIDPASGDRRTLLDGLPSGFAPPNNDPSGPSGLAMRGRTLYVTISLGDAVFKGPLPNSFIPNPNPSSPIFTSLLAVHFSANTEASTNGFVLSSSDQVSLKSGATVYLDNGTGDKLSVELVADFPDYVPEPRPGLPNAVRQSNPFGIALKGDHAYVADASSNIIRDVDLETRTFSTLTTFGPLPNNRGFGPPVVEPVPDSIHIYGDQLLVTLLSGFPFPIGNAQVRTVDIASGTSAPFITGLTSAIDVLPVAEGGFLTLEFSSDMLNPAAAGRLSFYNSASASPVVIANCLITPTSLSQDEKTKDTYVTEIFTGRVVKIPGNNLLP
ncbi:MAG TPA: ScyD/ScyE family protein [Pyrinomonadaceae bacterium]|nr:ScyD/ScyE family protein [Pyrinomonadaceae bacterium]